MNHTRIIKLQWLRRNRKLAIVFALLLSLWVGYQLASLQTNSLLRNLNNQAATIASLNDENHVLTQQLHQQQAKHSLCEAELKEVATKHSGIATSLSSCEQEIAFFKHVMAPELSGAMLSVEVVSLTKKRTDQNVYLLDLLLLQPRLQKAVVTGNLEVSVNYLVAPSEVTTLSYKFKFFQQLSVELAVADNQIPESISFNSDIFQYGRKRESLEQTVAWNAALSKTELAPQ